MSCETARILIENDDPGLAQHLESCLSCAIGANARYYEAPAGLEEKIRRSLRGETVAVPYWRWAAIAASSLLTISLGANLALLRSRISPGEQVTGAVLAAHVRSLAGTHLLDVPSTDQHTVKPWFNGKIDFSPPVRMPEGFPLIGGRLEYLEDRPAAALIYGRSKHIINLFVWPSDERTAGVIQVRRGYRMQSWWDNGMQFWAVSDLNAWDLGEFVRLYRAGP